MKIIKSILSVVMAVGIASQTVFAFPSDLDDVPVKDMTSSEEKTAGVFSDSSVLSAFKLLKYIGTIDEEESEFEENEPVSRGYAAAAFAAISSGSRSDTKISSFIDVPESNPYASGIQQAADRGILDTDTNKFYPSKNVSAEDIAKWSIRVLKQDYVLYNQSMFSAAVDLGIFKGVTYSQDLITKGQFMIVLENVLNADYIKMTGIDEMGNVKFTVSEDENYMNNVYGIYKQEGLLTGYKYSSIYGDIELDEGKIQINRSAFSIDEKVSMDFVGSYVGAYVDLENDNKIVSLWKNLKKTKITEILKEKINYLNLNEISYESESGLKRIKINDKVPFIYNNLYYGTFDAGIIAKYLYNCDSIVVVDNDGDAKGDIVKAYKYTHYIIKSVSVMTDSIVFKNNAGTLEIKDDSYAEFIYNSEPVESLQSFNANDVLTVLDGTKLSGAKVFVATVTRDLAEGKITSKSDDDKGQYYVIDGNKYYLSDEYIDYMNNDSSQKKPKSGDFVQLYIAADGKIVGAKTEDDFSYAYLMSSVYDINDETARVKLYTLDGKETSYFFADKVKVYNSEYLTGTKLEKTKAYEAVSGADGKIPNDMVAYSVNSEGLIVSFAVAIDRTAHSHGSLYYPLTLDYKGSGAQTRMYRNVYQQRYKMDSSVPILVRPAGNELLTDPKAYEIRSGNYWSVEHYFTEKENIKLYNCDRFYVPGFYTMESVPVTELSQEEGKVHMYCVAGVEDTIDADDMPIKKLSYYENGKLTSAAIAEDAEFVDAGLYCDVDEVEELRVGDVIQFGKDGLGNISIIRVVFSAQNKPAEFGSYLPGNKKTDSNTGKEYIEPVENPFSAFPSLNVIYGKVEDVEGSVVLVNTSKTGNDSKHIYPLTMGHSVYGSVYYNVYNSKTKEVTSVSRNEILTGDKVVLRRYFNHVQDVVIIR